jgi:hypothetical protein
MYLFASSHSTQDWPLLLWKTGVLSCAPTLITSFALCYRLTDSDISDVISLLQSSLQFLDRIGCQSPDGDCLTSLEQTNSTIKHVYLAKSEFRQDIHLIVDKLKCAFQIPGWSAMVVLPFYFASDHSSVSSLIDQYGDSVILRGGEKLLRQQELRLSESLYSENRILRQVPAKCCWWWWSPWTNPWSKPLLIVKSFLRVLLKEASISLEILTFQRTYSILDWLWCLICIGGASPFMVRSFVFWEGVSNILQGKYDSQCAPKS